MFDSTTATDIPVDATMVAGYVDGKFKWSDADWARFPNAVKVRIAALAETDDGDILDVEQGDATPEDSVGWVRARRSATGTEKSVYCNLSNIYDVRFAFVAASVALPPLWLAHYDNLPSLPAGFVAKQYADEALTGGHYDASVVADFWPGVDQIDKLGEQDMTVDQLLAMLNDPAVAEKINTFTAIKQVLADQAAAIKAVASAPDHVSDAELAEIVTKIGVGLEKIGADVAPKS